MSEKLNQEIADFSDKLEELDHNITKALEGGKKTIGTKATYPSKVENIIENSEDQIKKLEILIESSNQDLMDGEKVINALKELKDTEKLEIASEKVEVLKEEFLEFETKYELDDYSELSESVENIISLLNDDFNDEVNELKSVYGNYSLSTAFLLRRILEKAVFYSFCEVQAVDEIKDDEGNLVGLERMINQARGFEYGEGEKILDDRTGKDVQDVKFLGDVAAHNFSRTVSMSQIKGEIHKLEAALEELPITES